MPIKLSDLPSQYQDQVLKKYHLSLLSWSSWWRKTPPLPRRLPENTTTRQPSASQVRSNFKAEKRPNVMMSSF